MTTVFDLFPIFFLIYTIFVALRSASGLPQAPGMDEGGKPLPLEPAALLGQATTYYAEPLWDLRPREFPETETFWIDVPIYVDGDANNPELGLCRVKVIAPRDYQLTDKDHTRIDELVHTGG